MSQLKGRKCPRQLEPLHRGLELREPEQKVRQEYKLGKRRDQFVFSQALLLGVCPPCAALGSPSPTIGPKK